VDYQTFTAVTQSIPFIVIISFIWFFEGIIFYLAIAGITKARVRGKKVGKSMLSNRNAWLVPSLIWIIQAVTILFGLIFPYWIKLFNLN